MHTKDIGIIIYANPDFYPPVINSINVLSKEFNLIIICRNHDKTQMFYPANVRLYRLGKLKTEREKETQGLVMKIIEYILFTARTVFYFRYYHCQFIYSYNMHGFIAGLLVSCFGKKIPLIYHNLDLCELGKKVDLNYIIKYLELRLACYADKIVFPDINRAKFFQGEAKLNKLPDIVMNTPLLTTHLPSNRLKDILRAKGFAADAKVVLFQGAINESHSILEVVKSMVFWPENTILVLIGEISQDFLIQVDNAAKSLGVKDRIQYLTAITYYGLFYYTVGAYLGLAPYKPVNINQLFNAGAANKLFEYLSLGIPVVTTDSPYFREVVDSSVAYFTKPDSVEDIAKTINSAISDREEYRRKSQAARQAHLTRLNYEEQFRSIMEYIREVVK